MGGGQGGQLGDGGGLGAGVHRQGADVVGDLAARLQTLPVVHPHLTQGHGGGPLAVMDMVALPLQIEFDAFDEHLFIVYH